MVLKSYNYRKDTHLYLYISIYNECTRLIFFFLSFQIFRIKEMCNSSLTQALLQAVIFNMFV